MKRFKPIAVLLMLVATVAQAAPLNLIRSGGKFYVLEKNSAGVPVVKTIEESTLVKILDLDGGSSPPIDPPGDPLPLAQFEAKITEITVVVLQQRSGTKTTAAALASVYSLVADNVASDGILVKDALGAIKSATDIVFTRVTDDAAWTAWRAAVGNMLTKAQEDGVLDTKAQNVATFRAIAKGMNAASGFNGDTTNPKAAQTQVSAGILGDINITELIALIKAILDFIKLLRGGAHSLLWSPGEVLLGSTRYSLPRYSYSGRGSYSEYGIPSA